jgi:hypothetical protein
VGVVQYTFTHGSEPIYECNVYSIKGTKMLGKGTKVLGKLVGGGESFCLLKKSVVPTFRGLNISDLNIQHKNSSVYNNVQVPLKLERNLNRVAFYNDGVNPFNINTVADEKSVTVSIMNLVKDAPSPIIGISAFKPDITEERRMFLPDIMYIRHYANGTYDIHTEELKCFSGNNLNRLTSLITSKNHEEVIRIITTNQDAAIQQNLFDLNNNIGLSTFLQRNSHREINFNKLISSFKGLKGVVSCDLVYDYTNYKDIVNKLIQDFPSTIPIDCDVTNRLEIKIARVEAFIKAHDPEGYSEVSINTYLGSDHANFYNIFSDSHVYSGKDSKILTSTAQILNEPVSCSDRAKFDMMSRNQNKIINFDAELSDIVNNTDKYKNTSTNANDAICVTASMNQGNALDLLELRQEGALRHAHASILQYNKELNKIEVYQYYSNKDK